MKIDKQKLIVLLLVAILIAFIPLATAAPSGTSESAVVEAAKSWIGVKEVHGGNSRSGIDCSHLVYQVYKQVGARDIVFQTVPNMKKNKYYVTTTSPTPGDVIFWKKDVTQNNKTYWLAAHVGIYIGNSQFIHPDRKVTIETINGVYKDGIPYYARWEANDSDSSLPVAAFVASPTSGNAPLTVSFTDNSIGATSRSWIFGDGSTSAEKDPVHTYSTTGSYLVKLIVSNENGSDSESVIITVSGQPVPVFPKADFHSNLTSGFAPLDVQFTDASQNANGWNWDFGDGATSAEQSPSHIYSAEGNYTVILTVNNANRSASNAATITVQSQSSSDGGSSNGDDSSDGSSHSSGSSDGGGSGGGAGGSPEPQSNVEIKELSQTFITSGQPVKFDLTQKATAVMSINFDSKKTIGKTTTIVEMLKGKSTLTSDAPTGEVYKYLNIWVGNGGYATEKNIENAVVSFKVEKSWVQDKNIGKSSIILNRYNNTKWNALLTNLSGEDNKWLYFTAETPGFSPFAITGKIIANEAVNTTLSKTQTGPDIGSLENNASNAANVKQTSEQTHSPSTKMPGFETASGIVCLFGVFLHKKK